MARADSITTTVLLIAYHYAPLHSTGVQRVAKFEQYLPEFGYLTRVLTTSAFGGGTQDETVSRAWEPLGAYRWLFNGQARKNPGAAARVRTESTTTARLARVGGRLLVPDMQVTWIPAAVVKTLQELRSGSASLIYSSYPPASAHLVALIAKQMSGVPWVADFRDSWTADPLDPDLFGRPRRLALERRLESAVVRSADAIIASTSVAAQYLRESHPDHAERIHVITNGFDPSDLPEVAVAAPANDTSRPLHLVHTGSFSGSHPWRSPHGLLDALKLLCTDDPTWAQRIKVTLVGRLSTEEEQATADLQRSGLLQTIEEADHSTALKFQCSGDVLLLVDHPRPWPASNLPNKLFEYLGLRRPVLALCTPGMVADTVSELKAGLCAAPDDPAAIGDAIRQLHAAFVSGSLQQYACSEPLHRFHRRTLTQQLARLFDDVLGRDTRLPRL